MSRLAPQCPAASLLRRAPSRLSRLSPLVLALSALAVGGCYQGIPDPPEGTPWGGEEDPASDGADDMGQDGGGGTSAGEGGSDEGLDPGEDSEGGAETGAEETGGDDGVDPDGGSSDGGDDGGPAPVDVPDIPYCDEVAAWNPAWAQLELDVLELVNEYRASGANCGSEGSFGPAAPLTMHPALRCAARKHSKDMNDRMFFDHTNPSGESPWDRMGQAGYSYSAAGENIAGGSPDAAGTMNQWMNSDGHCANIMNPSFEEIGVGYYPGGQWGHLWTQAFGAQ